MYNDKKTQENYLYIEELLNRKKEHYKSARSNLRSLKDFLNESNPSCPSGNCEEFFKNITTSIFSLKALNIEKKKLEYGKCKMTFSEKRRKIAQIKSTIDLIKMSSPLLNFAPLTEIVKADSDYDITQLQEPLSAAFEKAETLLAKEINSTQSRIDDSHWKKQAAKLPSKSLDIPDLMGGTSTEINELLSYGNWTERNASPEAAHCRYKFSRYNRMINGAFLNTSINTVLIVATFGTTFTPTISKSIAQVTSSWAEITSVLTHASNAIIYAGIADKALSCKKLHDDINNEIALASASTTNTENIYEANTEFQKCIAALVVDTTKVLISSNASEKGIKKVLGYAEEDITISLGINFVISLDDLFGVSSIVSNTIREELSSTDEAIETLNHYKNRDFTPYDVESELPTY